jgi:hypothetical protein
LPGEFLPSNGNVPGHLLLQGSRESGPIAYSFNTATRENGFVVSESKTAVMLQPIMEMERKFSSKVLQFLLRTLI